MTTSKELLARYTAACDYPGPVDEAAVTTALERYLKALNVKREVVRLQRPWWRDEHLVNLVVEVLGKIPGKDPDAATR